MVGAGMAAAGMINSLRNNRKLLRPKRPFLNTNRQTFAPNRGQIVTPPCSFKVKWALQKHLKKEKIKRRNTNRLAFQIVIAPVLFIFLYVSITDHKQNDRYLAGQHEIKKANYLWFIEDGDQKWRQKFSQRKWHNALFQYRKAAEIFPQEYSINYRLAYTYTLRCEDEYKDCKQAKQQLDILLKEYQNKAEVQKLKRILVYEYQ